MADLGSRLAALPPLVLAARRRGPRAWLVGGLLRDALLGRPWPAMPEVDLAVPTGGVELARELAEGASGRLVILSPEDDAARVVWPELVVDVTAWRRPDLAGDLAARDFTVNALAAPLDDLLAGVGRLADPLGGLADLAAGRLVLAGPGVLREDPVRVWRGLRLAAELGFALPQATLAAMAQAAPLALARPGERCGAELLKLLACPRAGAVLALAVEAKFLCALVPELGGLSGMCQNRFHHLDGLGHTLAVLDAVEDLLAQGPRGWAAWTAGAPLWSEESRRVGLKLAALFHDSGKPRRRRCRPSGGLAFAGHEKLSASIWREFAARMRLGHQFAERVARLAAAHMRPASLLGVPALRGRRRLIQAAGDALPELGLLCLADAMASRGPAQPPDAVDRMARLWTEMGELETEMRAQAARPLLTGHEIMAALGLPPGPRIGWLLEELAQARLSGRVADRDQAMDFLRGRMGLGRTGPARREGTP